MNSLKIKKEIIRYSKLLNTTNLSPLRSGNISVRYKNGFFITPSGKKYSSLRSSDIVFVSLEGRHIKKHNPSSEWRFHRDIYKAKKYSGSIVHCHSHNALILSCLRKKNSALSLYGCSGRR